MKDFTEDVISVIKNNMYIVKITISYHEESRILNYSLYRNPYYRIIYQWCSTFSIRRQWDRLYRVSVKNY